MISVILTNSVLGFETTFALCHSNSVLDLENNFESEITNLVLGLGLENNFVSMITNLVLGLGLENNFVS